MKKLLVAVVIGIVAGCAIMQSKTVSGLYAEVYPSDAAKREALDLCIFANPQFNRFDLAARTACYKQQRGGAMASGTQVPTGSTTNQVDLRQAASQGSVPRNDVRLVQQSDGSMR